MSNNPFSKFVVDPSRIADPNTIKPRDFQQYTSNELRRIQSSLRVYRRSAIYLAGCAGLMLVVGWMSGNAGRTNILGADNQGGSYLDLKTVHDQGHYAYNRQFQRMMVLSQGLARDQDKTSDKLLVDLGVSVPRLGNHNIPKKAPHEKYY